jgi:[acyl-carrier-protein] S-malonyltransferase
VDVILLFPGQGSQKPGMARDVAAAYPAARAALDAVDAALGAPISRLCFEGPEEELTSTQNAQPALLAHGAAVWAVVRERLEPHVRAAAGHSLGEFTAYLAAGALSLADAARLVRRRGELMFESGVQRPGAMAAILGLAQERVEDACRRAAAEGGVAVPANYNAPDQVVISGEVAAVERAMALAREAGAKRALRLKVSGAFHSPLMEVARDGLRAALDAAHFAAPRVPVYSNVSASPTTDAATARRLLLEQLSAPVRWTALVRNLVAAHPGALFAEIGPGSVLSNLVRRIAPDARTVTCGTAAEIDALHATLS